MNSLGGINEDGTRTPYDEGSINKRREFRHLLYPLPSLEVSTNMAIDKIIRAGTKPYVQPNNL